MGGWAFFMPSPYQPVTAYDYPSVLLAQALDGELMSAAKMPQDMTPTERETVAQKVTQSLGWQNDKFLSAVADTVLNPWVLLMAGTSALGGFKLPGAGKLFHGMENTSAFVRQHGGIAQTLKLLTPGQALRGTFVEAAFMQADKEIEQLANASVARLAPVHEDLAARLSLSKGLATKGDMAQEVNDLLHIKLAGLDQAREVRYFNKAGELASRTVKPLVDSALVDQRVQELGLQPAIDAFRNEFVQTKKMLFGRDDVSHFEVDGAKVWKLQRNLRDGVFRGHTGRVMEGILGEDLASLKSASMTQQEFFDAISRRFSGALDEQFYMPRNQYVTRDTAGRIVPPEVRLTQKQGATLATTNAAAARTRSVPIYDIDDLKRLRKYASDGTELDRAEAVWQKVLSKPDREMFRFDKMNFAPAFEKYMNDAIRSKALFLSEPSNVILRQQEESLPIVRASIMRGKHRIPSEEVAPKFEWAGGGQSVLEPMGRAAPPGGWSVADAIWQGHQLMNDRVVQNSISDLYVPTLLGQMGPRGSLMTAVQLHAQGVTGAFLKAFGPTMDEAGPFGQKMRRTLKEFVDKDIVNDRGGLTTGNVAGYLYSSHLGFNLAPATMNLMQPFITTGRFVELPHLMAGYKEALASMGRYVEARAANPKTFLTAAEKWKAMLRAAPEDVLEDAGIGPSAMELIDAVGFTGDKMRPAIGPLDRVQQASLKLFEKTEWMNRLSAVFAQRSKQIASGMDPLSEVARQEVRTLVQETQFGGHWLNTPQAFLDPGSPMSNPLLRQFMTFPLRMATLTTNVAPEIGGANRSLNRIRDVIRGLGISALVYESGKHFLGPGIERGLYAGTVTSLMDQPPIPPIVDIPYRAVQAMTDADSEKIKRDIPRLFPGGVAISRMSGALPSLQSTPFGALQKEYVGWGQEAPDGTVPIFKSDGTLKDYVDPVDLVGRSLGFTHGAQEAADRDKWILRQREQIIQARREYLKALGTNDSARAQGVATQFKQRFGYDLSVTQQQVRNWQKLQTVPRTDRILNTLPIQARPVYQSAVGQMVEQNFGLQREALDASLQRRKAEAAKYQPGPSTPSSFEPFSPF